MNPMIKNYMRMAVRTILKNGYFSFINIFGLAISMAVCLVLIMLIADQKNNDRYNTNYDRIYRITHNRLNSDDFVTHFATAPLPVASQIMTEFDDLDDAVRIRRDFGNDWIGVEQNVNVPIGGFYVDQGFIDFFQYELLSGNAKTALSKPHSVVLKEKTALKLYGDINVIGKIITVGEHGDFIVTGVIKDNSEQSHIKFEALASLSTLTQLEEKDSVLYSSVNNWKNLTSGWVYIKLKDDVKVADVEQHLALINANAYGELEDFSHEFKLQALSEISPGPLRGNDIGPGLPIVFVYFLAGIALVVMISAAFNYMNLSIARALTRAREVGIRKVSGANKSQLIFQFLIEAVVLSLVALFIGQLLVILLKPAFKQLHFAELLQWDLRFDGRVFLIGVIFSIVIGLLAGIIPALTLAKFQPTKVLKDLSGIKLFSKLGLRKTLIIAQFTLSLVFIISATLIFNQLNYMVGADFGFQTDNIINVRLNNTSYEQLKTELLKYPAVENVTSASHIPASGTSRNTVLKKNWEDDVERDMYFFDVDENYLNTLGLELIAGHNFKSLNPSSNEIIVNEYTIASYELGNPGEAIGQLLLDADDSTEYRIIGVVKDYKHQMLIVAMSPMMLRYNPDNAIIAHVKINPSNSSTGGQVVEEAFAVVNPGLVIDSEPFTEQLIYYYDLLFGDIVKITSMATIMALIIACLGMLGMATYTIETRTKEVSIRKVLGATSRQLIIQLSKGFLSILFIAVIIAVPLAYLLNDLWLQKLAFRVDITFGVIAFGVFTLLILGALTIGSQTYRASTINPVDSLRRE